MDTEFALGMGSGGNFFLLLAVNKAQLSPAPGWETRNIPGSGDFWDKDLPSSSHPTERTRRGRGRTEDTWFVVWFKEHLNLSKDLGPGVAGGAAGSARTRHGRFLCAFLKGRGGENPASPGLSWKTSALPGVGITSESSFQPIPSAPKGDGGEEEGSQAGEQQQELAGKGLGPSPARPASCSRDRQRDNPEPAARKGTLTELFQVVEVRQGSRGRDDLQKKKKAAK